TSLDLRSYPILTFPEVPQIETILTGRKRARRTRGDVRMVGLPSPSRKGVAACPRGKAYRNAVRHACNRMPLGRAPRATILGADGYAPVPSVPRWWLERSIFLKDTF